MADKQTEGLSLKQAQEQGRMKDFIRQEQERVTQEHPDPRGRFAKLLRAMVGGEPRSGD